PNFTASLKLRDFPTAAPPSPVDSIGNKFPEGRIAIGKACPGISIIKVFNPTDSHIEEKNMARSIQVPALSLRTSLGYFRSCPEEA
ncbi:MAG: hypothetical protein WBH76_08635, partial [Dictyoglomaceae bacterium]|nr:hypothetical protein [Dictyoglomaceae bacterium]